VVVRRNQQRNIYEELTRNLLPDYKEVAWEKGMVEIDRLLEDEELIDIVHEALKKRHPQSGRRGRPSTPSEVVLRMLVLKHMKNWSFEELVREVRANLMYREFTRIGTDPVPDDKTLVKLGQAIGSEATKKIHSRIVGLAIKNKAARGRRMRVDTTVVETNIHYPTDSSLLGDGVRVITRTVKRLQEKVGGAQKKFRSRVRSVQHRLIELGKMAAHRGEKARERREQVYRKLMRTTRRVIGDADKTIRQVSSKIKKETDQRRRAAAEKLIERVQETVCLTERVLKQTRARVIKGETHYEEKLVSIFETKTEVIRKGKASKPTEFGKIVKIQEAENQIITDYEVFESRPADQALLIPAIDKHEELFGKVPELVATDGGFHSISNIEEATQRGVKKLAVPGRRGRGSGKGKKRRERWFREAQRWRVGCEGRISVLKRRSGLFRSRYKGTNGMKRWVGFGVIADNLITLGVFLSSA
jgi:IS5 family transposase